MGDRSSFTRHTTDRQSKNSPQPPTNNVACSSRTRQMVAGVALVVYSKAGKTSKTDEGQDNTKTTQWKAGSLCSVNRMEGISEGISARPSILARSSESRDPNLQKCFPSRSTSPSQIENRSAPKPLPCRDQQDQPLYQLCQVQVENRSCSEALVSQ